MTTYGMKTYIDPETGELLEGDLHTEERIEQDRIAGEKQRKRIKAKQDHDRKKSSGDELTFHFSLMENIKGLLQDLEEDKRTKRTYQGYILQLQTYTNYENILYLSNENKKPLNRTGIQKVLGISKQRNAKPFIDLMLDLSVLEQVKTDNGNGFKMNRKYSLKGKTNNKKVVKVFNENVRQLYKENSEGDVCFLYSLIPYISYEDNVIAWNPYELDPSNIDVLKGSDIAEVTGMSAGAVSSKRQRMTFNGMYIFMVRTMVGKSSHVINPSVFYRKPYEPDESLVRSFLFIPDESLVRSFLFIPDESLVRSFLFINGSCI